jgi:threonine/homoserine/homoserine lactone efflux protein
VGDAQLRAAQGAAQLGQVVRREANVRAYNDVFHVVALVAFAYLAWSLWQARRAQRAAARAALQNQPATAGGADGEVGTDAAITDAPEPESASGPSNEKTP